MYILKYSYIHLHTYTYIQGHDTAHRPDSRNGYHANAYHPNAYGYPQDTQRTGTTEEEEEEGNEEDSYSASDRTIDPSESVTSSFLDSAREPVVEQ